MTSLAELEANMDAKVIAIREHVSELAEHSPKPSEVEHSFLFNLISDSIIPRL